MTAMLILLLTGQILHEKFDDPRALEAWERMDGAVTGDGRYSVASIDDGALRLEGEESTERWLALTRTVPVGDAKWIRISARMRTRSVSPETARFQNCNLFFRFGRGPLMGTRILSGTNDSVRVARRLEVPDDADEITVGCLLSMPGKVWFDDVMIEAVGPPPWKTSETEHYRYHWLDGDSLPEESREYNKQSYVLVSEFFERADPIKVSYYKYPDLDTKEEYTGKRGNAHVWEGAIHSIWPSDRHEIVHILCKEWGDPPAIFGEGIAVYLSGKWLGKSLKEAARQVTTDGKWVSIAKILDTGSFRKHSDLVAYPIAGSFVQWLVETRGKETLRKLYGALRNTASSEDNRRAFKQVLGLSAKEANLKFTTTLTP